MQYRVGESKLLSQRKMWRLAVKQAPVLHHVPVRRVAWFMSFENKTRMKERNENHRHIKEKKRKREREKESLCAD